MGDAPTEFDERELIRDLANELVSCILEVMQEGGGYTDAIGQPVDNGESTLQKACDYLGQPMPLVPSWDNLVPPQLT